MADTTAFITLENISKQFPGVLALDNVNLTLRKGEVHQGKIMNMPVFKGFVA